MRNYQALRDAGGEGRVLRGTKKQTNMISTNFRSRSI